MHRNLPGPSFPSFLFPCLLFAWPPWGCHLSSKDQMPLCPLALGPRIPIVLAYLSVRRYARGSRQTDFTGSRVSAAAKITSKIHTSKWCGWLAQHPWLSAPALSSCSLACALTQGKLESDPFSQSAAGKNQWISAHSSGKAVDPLSKTAENDTNVLLAIGRSEGGLHWICL